MLIDPKDIAIGCELVVGLLTSPVGAGRCDPCCMLSRCLASYERCGVGWRENFGGLVRGMTGDD